MVSRRTKDGFELCFYSSLQPSKVALTVEFRVPDNATAVEVLHTDYLGETTTVASLTELWHVPLLNSETMTPRNNLACIMAQLHGRTGLVVEHVRSGSAHIYRVNDNAIMRITNQTYAEHNAHIELVTALGAPALQPLTTEVVELYGWTASLWPMGEPATGSEHAAAFGDALSRLHISTPPPGLKRGDPLAPVPARIAIARRDGVPAALLNPIEQRYRQLKAPCAEMMESGNDPIMWDTHIGNAVIVGGELKLIDLGDLSLGPWQADFMASIVSRNRKPDGPVYEQVYRHVRGELDDWRFRDTGVAVRELTMMSWLASLWGRGHTYKAELARRIDSWQRPDAGLYWTAL